MCIRDRIWTDWEKFASYAFNKSHATCYSWVAYQTAYLKANYPSEYMAAVMSRSLSNITDITKLMDECKAMGIQTLGPDVNESKMCIRDSFGGYDVQFEVTFSPVPVADKITMLFEIGYCDIFSCFP